MTLIAKRVASQKRDPNGWADSSSPQGPQSPIVANPSLDATLSPENDFPTLADPLSPDTIAPKHYPTRRFFIGAASESCEEQAANSLVNEVVRHVARSIVRDEIGLLARGVMVQLQAERFVNRVADELTHTISRQVHAWHTKRANLVTEVVHQECEKIAMEAGGIQRRETIRVYFRHIET